MKMDELETAGVIELIRMLNYDVEDLEPELIIYRLAIQQVLIKLADIDWEAATILLLRYQEDRGQKEIAKMFNRDQSTISRKLTKGLKQAEKLLDAELH